MQKLLDTIGYSYPEIETNLYKLCFEPLNTVEKFQDYDGVILFQGTFEEIKAGYHMTEIECHKSELQRRKKQCRLLDEKKGFICFLLIAPFIDKDVYGDKSNTDLAKWGLSSPRLYRHNFSEQITSVKPLRNEFIDFLKHYGAAWTYFTCTNDQLEIKEICRCEPRLTGMILWNREYFIPTLRPQQHEVEGFFKILADSLINSHKKLSEEIPNWADEYLFEEEKQLIEKKRKFQEQINIIDQRILKFREYKKAICYGDELLRESIIKIFKDGFDFKLNEVDELKEDFKIIDEDSNPLVLIEVKGTNKGIKREHINQTDNHRERAGLDNKFPSVLIVNTNIKRSNSIQDKYLEVAKEQIAHAEKMNVLVMRAIDLLNTLYLKEAGKLKKEELSDILRKEIGWLEVSQNDFKVHKK